MTSAAAPLSDLDLEEIAGVVSAAQEAQVDPEVLLALHAPGAVIVNLAGRRVLGRDAFGEAMAAALASPLRDVLTEVTIEDIRAPTRDIAVVSCTKLVHDRRAAEPGVGLPDRGALTYVMVRADQGWEIVLAQTTPIMAG